MCEVLNCTCCGRGLCDTPEENVSHGQSPYPHDTGFGLCRECGGDPTADTTTDEGVRKRMGWQMTTFREARFDLLRRNLNAENQAKWDGLSYAKKCSVVLRLVRDGTIV
jgi:hypothetical protein